MQPNFHLSISVCSIEESANFFIQVLRGRITHKSPCRYLNVDLRGNEVILKETSGPVSDDSDFHFGVNLSSSDFEALAKQIQTHHPNTWVQTPRVVDAGTSLQRRKMYLNCPTGYLIEIKGYPSLEK